MICKYAEIFCWKNVSSFCSAKATHIFSAKNIRILYTESAKTVNEMTLNKLVKLTMLWTTGPWYFIYICSKAYCLYSLELPWWGSSNEYSQSMFSSRNKKNNEYLCKPQFYYIKVGFKGVRIILVYFRDMCAYTYETHFDMAWFKCGHF